MHGKDQAQDGRRPVGRRSGDSGTRDAILDAALESFAERGYDAASVRAIAARADVDPALIRHFFGDKFTLFATTVVDRTTILSRWAEALEGDQETIGLRLTDAYLGLWDDPQTRPILLALVRSAVTSPKAAGMLSEILGARVHAWAGAEDEQTRRIALAAAYLFGVAFARHVIPAPAIAAVHHDTLVTEIAPTIQSLITSTGA